MMSRRHLLKLRGADEPAAQPSVSGTENSGLPIARSAEQRDETTRARRVEQAIEGGLLRRSEHCRG
jgi:hypothetical protein